MAHVLVMCFAKFPGVIGLPFYNCVTFFCRLTGAEVKREDLGLYSRWVLEELRVPLVT